MAELLVYYRPEREVTNERQIDRLRTCARYAGKECPGRLCVWHVI